MSARCEFAIVSGQIPPQAKGKGLVPRRQDRAVSPTSTQRVGNVAFFTLLTFSHDILQQRYADVHLTVASQLWIDECGRATDFA